MGKFALASINKRKFTHESGGGNEPARDNYIIFEFHYEGSLTWTHVFNAWAARQYLAAEIYGFVDNEGGYAPPLNEQLGDKKS